MIFTIEIDNAAYARLLAGLRVRGSIGLTNPHDTALINLNFTPYPRRRPAPCNFSRLRHGKVSVGPEFVRLSLFLDRREKTDHLSALRGDTCEALNFICKEIDPHDDD